MMVNGFIKTQVTHRLIEAGANVVLLLQLRQRVCSAHPVTHSCNTKPAQQQEKVSRDARIESKMSPADVCDLHLTQNSMLACVLQTSAEPRASPTGTGSGRMAGSS